MQNSRLLVSLLLQNTYRPPSQKSVPDYGLRGWRRPPAGALPSARAPAPVGGARDRRGTRGGGPAGWIPVGRRSAVPVPKFTKP